MAFFWNKKKEIRQTDNCVCENTDTYNDNVGGLNFLTKLLGNQDLPQFIDAYFSALELISNTIASLVIYFTDKNKEENPKLELLYDELFNHNLLNKFNMVKNFIVDLYNKGNAFIYIHRDATGKPVELQYIDAKDVNIRYLKKQNLVYYTAPTIISGQIEAENMIHVFKNTEDMIEGKPLSFYAGKILRLAGLSEKQAEAFFSSGCALSGVLSYQGNLSDKQKQEIRENWRQTYGNGKTGIVVMGGNMNYSQLGSNSKDAQLLESRVFNVQAVARYFNISPNLLGDLSHTSFNSLEASQLQLLINCIGPVLRLIEEEINRKLWPKKVYFHFDENSLLRCDKQSESNYYTTLLKSGILTVNECREALGFNKIDKPECDELYMLYTDLNQNKLNNQGNNEGNNEENNENNASEEKQEDVKENDS